MRNGQSGLFSNEELNKQNGLLWDPKKISLPEKVAQNFPRATSLQKFPKKAVNAFFEGNLEHCFGAMFRKISTEESLQTNIPHGQMQFIHEILELHLNGGPWERGYLKAIQFIASDDWFFSYHLLNDPCMPGTFMLEGAIQSLAFYLTAVGLTLNKNGRFELIKNEILKLKTRSQIIPSTKTVTYEIFVVNILNDLNPKIIAHVLGKVDDLPAFHANLGLEFIQDEKQDQSNLAGSFHGK